ncbi:MAG: MerC domain-containing protein [Flavobacteriales bacterium]|nr:MerC domain-containing protein [Flavobacteriales bacterium]
MGAAASGLCMIHCMATPFIFIAHSCSAACCETAPAWWRWIDIGFLIISFFAVMYSGKHTTKVAVKWLLWITWIALAVAVMNENLGWFAASHWFKYSAATGLVAVHIYNLKFCRCQDDQCCAPAKT